MSRKEISEWKYKELKEIGLRTKKNAEDMLRDNYKKAKEMIYEEIKKHIIKRILDGEIELCMSIYRDLGGRYNLTFGNIDITNFIPRKEREAISALDEKYNKKLDKIDKAFNSWIVRICSGDIQPFEIKIDLTL